MVHPAHTSLEDSLTYSVTIDYDYDPLNRLAGVTYSSGEVYTYTYDKVGNRSSLISPKGSTSYEYDNADRLIQVDGVDYSWDDNGNLLSDGVYTYTYDYDNRLTSAYDGIDSFGFAYNALGDRYQQTANGETVTYTLDIASDLSQVLMDGDYTYLYGLGRLPQENESRTDYFLPDALGSARQLTTQNGNIGLTQSFDPFGNPFSAMGPSSSSYGYTGEWVDITGLQFLRARYYAPDQGRFTSRDPFPGFLSQPNSLTPYVYALNNPVLLTDPSGENTLFLVGILGGLLGGTIYGYGSQVIRNLNQGMCFWDALSTNIDAGQVALFAAVGTLLGTGVGGVMVGIKALVVYFGIGSTIGTTLSADGDPTNELQTVINVVYRVVENGITKYVGITNNFLRRAGEHFSERGWVIRPIQGMENLSRYDARAVEQVLIEQYGLNNLYNQINSIASQNPIYSEAVRRGIEILYIIGYLGQ
jgi:RHS repeat-associated protein